MSSERATRRVGSVQSLEGPEEVILGADLDDVSVAVMWPRDDPPTEGELSSILEDAGVELEHYGGVRGLVTGRQPEDGEDEPELVTDGGEDPAEFWEIEGPAGSLEVHTCPECDFTATAEDVREAKGCLLDGCDYELDDPELVTDGGRPIFKATVELPDRDLETYVRARDQRAAWKALDEEYGAGYVSVLYELGDPDVDEEEILDAPELVADGGVAHSRESVPRRAVPRLNRTLTFAFAGAVLIHGPLDVLLTSAAFHLEANNLVTSLGLPAWVAIKVGLLSVATFAWYDAPRFNPDPYVLEAIALLSLLAGFGLALVFQNVVTLAGVLG